MDQKRIDTGEIVSGFAVRKTYEGQKDFDKDYIDREIVKVAKKVGDGDKDFVIVDEVKETKRPIRETILSQFDSAGINAYLAPFMQTGQPLPGVTVDPTKIDDYSNMPEDLAGACATGDNLTKLFFGLDPALRGKAKTPEEFLRNLNDDKIKAYLESKLPKKAPEIVNESEVK